MLSCLFIEDVFEIGLTMHKNLDNACQGVIKNTVSWEYAVIVTNCCNQDRQLTTYIGLFVYSRDRKE